MDHRFTCISPPSAFLPGLFTQPVAKTNLVAPKIRRGGSKLREEDLRLCKDDESSVSRESQVGASSAKEDLAEKISIRVPDLSDSKEGGRTSQRREDVSKERRETHVNSITAAHVPARRGRSKDEQLFRGEISS